MRRIWLGAWVIVLAACGSSTGVKSNGADSVATQPPGTTVAATTPTESSTTSAPTSAATTSAASTTPATSTTAPPTTEPARVNAWTEVESLPPQAGVPCCDSNYSGFDPSPQLTPEPQPLADGIYAAQRAGWSVNDAGRMLINVRRFELCTVVSDGCNGGEPYFPDDLGVDVITPARSMSIALDDSVDVAVGGYRKGEFVAATATGTDLRALLTALAAAYETDVAAPLRAGASLDSIVEDLTTNPRDGFSSDSPEMGGGIVFSYDNAPPILFQTLLDHDYGGPMADSGTAILVLTALQVTGGHLTLYLYGGFYS